MDNFSITDKNKVKRSPQRGTYNRGTVYEILDDGIICYVAFIDKGGTVIIPMCYGRKENFLYLHGSSSSRIINLLANGKPICINVTALDGIVVARSMYDTSLNYRSVVVYGKAVILHEDEKPEALHCISENIVPGRWNEVRAPLYKELKAISILKVNIEQASAKIRNGPPEHKEPDLDLSAWAGVIPLRIQAGKPVRDPALSEEQALPGSVRSILEKYSEH